VIDVLGRHVDCDREKSRLVILSVIIVAVVRRSHKRPAGRQTTYESSSYESVHSGRHFNDAFM